MGELDGQERAVDVRPIASTGEQAQEAFIDLVVESRQPVRAHLPITAAAAVGVMARAMQARPADSGGGEGRQVAGTARAREERPAAASPNPQEKKKPKPINQAAAHPSQVGR